MTNPHARTNAEAENDRWLARLAHIQNMIRTITAFITVGENLEDCLVTGEGRHQVTHMAQGVDEMKITLDILEREERRIRRELDDRGIAP